VLWFTANPNGEAEVLKIFLKPRPKLKKLVFEFDLSNLAIKGRASMGNILSRNPIHKIQLKSIGVSQFGGQSIWFDQDINRLDIDSRGLFLGEFLSHDHILVVCKNGEYYTTNFDLSNRYQGEIRIIEKLDTHTIFTAIYFDGEQNCFYIKRFSFEPNDNIVTTFISDTPESYLHSISTDKYPQAEVKFAGKHAKRSPEYVDVEEFISSKSFRAKGKRLTTFEVGEINFIQPLIKENNAEILDTAGDEAESTESEPVMDDISPTLF